MQEDEWQMEENLVLEEGKVYVLKDGKLRMEIIQLYHDIPVAGHRGRWKTTKLITRNYWWPGVMKYVGKYIDRYDLC